MPDLPLPERYVLARLRGLNDDEAAADAGYTSRPSRVARDLHHLAATLAESPKRERVPVADLVVARGTIERRVDRLELTLQSARDELRRVKLSIRATQLLNRGI